MGIIKMLPEIWNYIFRLCSSKDRSILCQVSNEWSIMAIEVSSRLSILGCLYYNQVPFKDNDLYGSGDYHLIVKLKRKYISLHTACRSGNIDVANLMISRGANDWNGGLSGACKGGHLELAKLMISKGANNWNWGLRGACEGGHLELAKLMISHGANDWNWGLRGACGGGHLELVNLMIFHGANDWNHGLRGACGGDHLELAKLMIYHGANNCRCGRSLGEHYSG